MYVIVVHYECLLSLDNCLRIIICMHLVSHFKNDITTRRHVYLQIK